MNPFYDHLSFISTQLHVTRESFTLVQINKSFKTSILFISLKYLVRKNHYDVPSVLNRSILAIGNDNARHIPVSEGRWCFRFYNRVFVEPH